MPRGENMLDLVALDLASWIDDAADRVALAFAPARAPFSAHVTEQQKMDFYTKRLFNPDGTPNVAGRAAELERLGAENFGKVYMAVIAAHPELKPPPPEEQMADFGPPPMPPGMPMLGGPPPGPPMGPPPMGGPPPGIPMMAEGGIVTQPTLAIIGEAGPEAVVPLDQMPPYQFQGQPIGQVGQGSQLSQAAPVPPPPPAPPISPWDDIIRQHAGAYAEDPRFVRLAAAAARAEGMDNPQQYQFGYKANDPRTHQMFGGRGLWQFDINKGAKGYGIPEEQLFDPAYQASVIVPEFAQAYQQVTAEIAAGKRPRMSDAELASLVAAMTERPEKWDVPTSPARQNYIRAYNELAAGAPPLRRAT